MMDRFRGFSYWLALGSLAATLWGVGCSAKDKPQDPDRSGAGGAHTTGGTSTTGGDDSGSGGTTGGQGTAGDTSSGAAAGDVGSGGTDTGAGGANGGAGAPDLGDGSGLPDAPAGSWTYLVYMLADNNLEPFALDDLNEMMAVGSAGKVTILVQIDRAVGESSAAIGGLANFTSTKRVRVDAGKLTELEDLGEQNLGAEQTFRDFLEWGLTYSPSQHYAVVLWDHGGAWPRYGADDSAGGDGLTLPELQRGIDDAAKSTGLLGPLDLLGFDACLMGTWEVAASFVGRSRYLLASEEVEPGHGWDHRKISLLAKSPTPAALGQALATGYQEQAEAEGDSARITLALTDLAKVPELTRAIGTLAGGLTNPIATHAPLVGRARAGIPTFGQIPGGPSTGMVDLLQLVTAVAELDDALAKPIAAVKGALDAAVVTKVSGPAFADAGGLSLFFPQLKSGYDSDYTNVADAAGWRGFLSAYYASAGNLGQSPEFTNTDKLAEVSPTTTGLHIAGQLRAGTFDNLASTSFDFGIVTEQNAVYLLGQEPAAVDAAGLVARDWDQSALQLVQGATSDFAYYVLETVDNGLLALSVPLDYNDGTSDEFVLMQLVFQPDGTLISNNYYSESSGSWAELAPTVGSVFHTLVPLLPAGAADVTWEPQPQSFDTAAALNLQFSALPSGINAIVQLSATDYADQGDTVSAIGTL